MPKLSIIIPTHKRPEILFECLSRIEKQTIVDQLEVIVVSDGPDEQTKNRISTTKFQMSVSYFEIEKSQQGAARNKGVSEASGEYVMFIGDDIFLAEDACERHLLALENSKFQIPNSKLAVLGHTTWDPSIEITPVMRWLESSGWQFGYPNISVYAHGIIPSNIQHRYSYTSHISLPLAIAKKMPFRTDVHLYGWEDIEWGMRLKNAGVHLFYEPDAKAVHHHHITLEQSLQRMEILGRSAIEIAKISPEFDRVPKGFKLFAYKILAMFPTMAGRHRQFFLQGLFDNH